jgi:hypothetical protein
MSSLQLQFHANVLEESRVLQEICLLRELFLQLQIHANVLEEVECWKKVFSCNLSSYCSNISMDNALEESAIQLVLQEYLLQRNVFIPCLQDGESLSHFLPWSIAPRTPTAWTAPRCTISHVWSDKKLLRGGRLIHTQLSCSSNKTSHAALSVIANEPTLRTADPQTRVSLHL